MLKNVAQTILNPTRLFVEHPSAKEIRDEFLKGHESVARLSVESPPASTPFGDGSMECLYKHLGVFRPHTAASDIVRVEGKKRRGVSVGRAKKLFSLHVSDAWFYKNSYILCGWRETSHFHFKMVLENYLMLYIPFRCQLLATESHKGCR
jgi:hypothetical protein